MAKEVAERREREAFDAALEAARTKIKAFADSIARFAEATLAGMDELIARQRRVPAIRDEVRMGRIEKESWSRQESAF